MIAAILELRLHLKQLETLNADADKCRQRLNGMNLFDSAQSITLLGHVKKAQDRLSRIMQNDNQVGVARLFN
jgi:hypothetical protein